MRISIQPAAVDDLRRGYRFYECQEKGLDAYFLDSLASDIASLQLHAGIHPMQFGRFHHLLAKRFPYAVYYQIENDTALVRAAFDLRRDPAWMAAKMRKR